MLTCHRLDTWTQTACPVLALLFSHVPVALYLLEKPQERGVKYNRKWYWLSSRPCFEIAVVDPSHRSGRPGHDAQHSEEGGVHFVLSWPSWYWLQHGQQQMQSKCHKNPVTFQLFQTSLSLLQVVFLLNYIKLLLECFVFLMGNRHFPLLSNGASLFKHSNGYKKKKTVPLRKKPIYFFFFYYLNFNKSAPYLSPLFLSRFIKHKQVNSLSTTNGINTN